MRSPHLKKAVFYFLTAVAGGAAGYWLGRGNSAATEGKGNERESRVMAAVSGSGGKVLGGGTGGAEGAGGVGRGKGADAGGQLMASLKVRKGHLRWSGTMEAVRGMNESNWREAVEALERITANTGAEFFNERVIVLTRAGEVGGRPAVEEMVEKNRAAGRGYGTASQVFEGWVSREPEAAWAWMQECADKELRRACLPRFVWGMAAADDGTRFEYFKQLPEADKVVVANDAARALLQTEGFGAAEQLLASELEGAGTGGGGGAAGTIFDVIAAQRRRAVEKGADPEEGCRWLEGYAGRPFVSEQHFSKQAQLLAGARGANAAAEWMASVYTVESAAATGPALDAAVQGWAAKDAGEAGQWLQGQRQHPGYATMVRAYATAIEAQDPAAAAAWRGSVP